MPVKLSPEEIVTLNTLKRKGKSNVEIGRTLGVTEGTVRYHAKRKAQGAVDGRKGKEYRAQSVSKEIDLWLADHQARQQGRRAQRPANLKTLYEWLVNECNYQGSYRSVVRFVRATYPSPKLRPFRRVETPAGAQGQVDWLEFKDVDLGNGPETLYQFVTTLSWSRMPAAIWSRRTDQLAWHHCHNEAFRRLDGIPAVMRIDNLRTGVAHGAGPWGKVNEQYANYAATLKFHVDMCLPRCPEDKGKVERRGGALRSLINPSGKSYAGLGDLQKQTDEKIMSFVRNRKCPATGKSILWSWQEEKRFLRPVGRLPEVYDVSVTRPVHKDCTVNFENHTYSVPFVLVGRTVEVRGCAEVVQIVHDGKIQAEHPRHSRAPLVIDSEHYEGEGDDRVMPPVPLGKMGKKLMQIASTPVELRPLDLYAALAEVAR